MARRPTVVAATLLLVVSLAACAKEKPSGLPTLTPGGGDSTSDSSSGTVPVSTAPTVADTPITTGPVSPSVGPPSSTGVHAGKIVTSTPDQKAVADVFLRYLALRLAAYNKVEVDLSAISKVATGQAISGVKAAVEQLRSNKQHTIGELYVNIPGVQVKGTTATMRSCMDNTTIDVDVKGKAAENPVPYFSVDSTFEKAGGTIWVVKTVRFTQVQCK
ncbi:hypothetical protein OG474_24525 [Kribbella sp. NBC_01505]|uniref:hypothetical protein n=1 Tax=Kribbella sp. NBC_01505 TaxID=2903580 RepID=UPI003869926F